jgi:hypothetical protein
VTERWRICLRESICRRLLDEEGALYSGKPREERVLLSCEIVRQNTPVGGRSPFFALGYAFGIKVTLSHRRAPQSHPECDLIQEPWVAGGIWNGPFPIREIYQRYYCTPDWHFVIRPLYIYELASDHESPAIIQEGMLK